MEKCVIIGSGCAGLTAGIYAARSGMEPLVIGGLLAGGQLMLTSEVENFPGFEQPILGTELMERMRKQCERLEVRFVNDQIDRVDFKKSPFSIWTSESKEITASTVIVATGANAKWLGLPSEEKYRAKGVSACAVCDGFFFKGKELVVAGGGDTAMEEATFLTRFAAKVTVVHRRDKLRASPAMEEKARKNLKIEFAWDSVIEEVLGNDMVTGVRVKNFKTQATRIINCGGLFVAIGHEPATSFLKGHLKLDDKGYIVPLPGSWVKTSIEGVFAAGDCVDHRYRQAVTAAGYGCIAAMEARWWLEDKGLG
ncbi:MAG: thioredoxin-disulfide reductase [Elusimicrobia bacterium]|nr:thioredoxin-disulfide reductase [Elusimicrobiota bacterium]